MNVAKFDADKIRSQNRIEDVAARNGIVVKKDGREFKACCPFHGEDTPSFTIYEGKHKQQYHCFGCNRNGDVIDFVQELFNVDFPEACRILGGEKEAPDVATREHIEREIVDPYAGFKVVRPPVDAPAILPGKKTPELFNPKRADDPEKAFVTYTPTLVHPYTGREGHLLGYVLRVDMGEGRKLTPAILWMKNEATGFEGWSHGAMPEPRPPYGLRELYEHPEKQVLIVEGEKCRDCAAALLDPVVSIAWLGGGKSYAKTNWTHMRGKRVVIWPDNDGEGIRTVFGYWNKDRWIPGIAEIILRAEADVVKIIDVPGDDKPKGWDIYDAHHDDKWSAADILAFAKAKARTWTLQDQEEYKEASRPQEESEQDHGDQSEDPAPPVEQAKPTQQAKPDHDDKTVKTDKPKRERKGNVIAIGANAIPIPEVDGDWRANLLTNEEGKIRARLYNNFIWMLTGHEQIRGTFGWNEMAREIFVIKKPPWDRSKTKAEDWKPRKIADNDVTGCVAFMERVHLTPKPNEILQVIATVSMDYKYNPVRHYLQNLQWDGCPRLLGGMWEGDRVTPFVVEHFGVPEERAQIHSVMLTKWLVSAVARVVMPGVKADCMIVLEGPQGFKKSTFLKEIATVDGVIYFTDGISDIESKDAALQMQGTWIAEIPELDAFRRKETDAIKAWLSRSTDRFRPPYAKMVADFDRQSVIAGTVNPTGHGYLKDPTGARRFWPIPVRKMIDAIAIRKERDQMWAEAVAYYRAKMQWYLTDDEVKQAREVTDERQEDDPWAHVIDDMIQGQNQASIPEIINRLAIPASQQSGYTSSRIAAHLSRRGFHKTRDKSDITGKQARVWVRRKKEDGGLDA